jgi:transcription termination factor Rho
MSPRAKSKPAEAESDIALQDPSVSDKAAETSTPKARSPRKTTRKSSTKTSKTATSKADDVQDEASPVDTQATDSVNTSNVSQPDVDDADANSDSETSPKKATSKRAGKSPKASATSRQDDSDDNNQDSDSNTSNNVGNDIADRETADTNDDTNEVNAKSNDPESSDAENSDAETRDQDSDDNDKGNESGASGKSNSTRKRRSGSKSRGGSSGGSSGGNGSGSESGRGGRNSKRKSRKARADNDSDDSDQDDNNSDGSGRRGRNKRRNGQRSQLNYRDLQTKIIPELHLLAKEVGLEDFRSMSKDDLALAVLERSAESDGLKLVSGFLEITSDGYGFLQESMLQNDTRSVIVSAGLIKQFKLRTGDHILGKSRLKRENERYGTLIRVEAVNNSDPFLVAKRPRFDDLVPTFPEERIRLETTQSEVATRVIDLLAPIGRGQRGLIVAPPKAGKTTLLKKVANAVVANEPDIKVIVLLVDERPEEVTDFRESVEGVEVVASTFDEPPTNHIRVAEFVHERARRIVEDGGHVMILLDSITRLARANNLVTPPTGRTLSGGLDSSALHWPKRFLGAARNIRGGGSLSILATALVETGSRMDDVIFEEFKGTGNMELHLSRRLEERRIFPALDILKSGTRREDLLLGEETLAKMWLLRKVISDMDSAEAMDMLLSRLSRTTSNEEFLSTLTQG